ncbi:CapA family protein [Microbacterium halophytorum]|uniref:CapA family protein n=1 Tax=Microbacterium halophytorum TaxID=2067568 RepID=UPI000CFCA689|nr:CapA family protein [Microbacterium halophytorum]
MADRDMVRKARAVARGVKKRLKSVGPTTADPQASRETATEPPVEPSDALPDQVYDTEADTDEPRESDVAETLNALASFEEDAEDGEASSDGVDESDAHEPVNPAGVDSDSPGVAPGKAEPTNSTPKTKVPKGRRVALAGAVYALGADGAKLVSVDRDLTKLEIPAAVEGLPVTTIGKGALAGSSSLTSVLVPETVTLIGSEAFANCTSLREIELPSDLQVINAETFAGCTTLERVFLPYDLQRIASRAFADCSSLVDMPHYVKTGISLGLTVDRTIVERSWPTELRYIGEEALRGCSSLRKIVIPFRVRRVPRSAFEGCSSLAQVWLHSGVRTIEENAFAGCTGLERIAVPGETETIGKSAFAATTAIVCEEGSPAHAHALEEGLASVTAELPEQPVVSQFGAEHGLNVSEVLASPELLQVFLDRFDLRPAAEPIERGDEESNRTPIVPSRFELHDGVYRPADPSGDTSDEVTISMVGDLMSRFKQQSSALQDGVYDFTESFEAITPLLTSTDLAIGNMETMVSSSTPYMHESKYIDDRPHLNTAFAFVAAVRQGGFDLVMNAQNHMYDAGTRGVLETLDALNRAELIHNGMYASPADPHYVLFEIKGIRIGVVSFLDGARQKMKQANFTSEGLATITSQFEESRVRADIAAAREAGAEFVIAYAHWGREYTTMITERQERFAQMVVDGGADYVFGSHSHCPQSYTIVEAEDGRRVPVIYSGGNFLSDIGLARPITMDTFVARLTLGRDAGGSVVIKGDGYTPCRILEGDHIRGFVKAVPADALLDGAYGYSPLRAEEDVSRIAAALGTQYTQLAGDGSPLARLSDESRTATPDDALVDAYSVQEPTFFRQDSDREEVRAEYAFDDASGTWKRDEDTALDEAIVLVGGSLMYDGAMERAADMGDTYQFRPLFRHVRKLLQSADLAIGSFGSVVADMYPPMSLMRADFREGHYANARPQYLDALMYAGFDCLALANPFNLDAGVRGIASTERATREAGIAPSGLGINKAPIFEVNGIRIAVLSYTMNAYQTRKYITNEGAKTLLNEFDEERAREDIQRVREGGAEYVLTYLDCRSAGEQIGFNDRLAAARRVAEAGADYVVCSVPNVLSKYRVHTTSDQRRVPIATGLGTLMAGPDTRIESPAAVVKVAIRRLADGSLEADAKYVPVRRYATYDGAMNAIVPAGEGYVRSYRESFFAEDVANVEQRIGGEVAQETAREVRVSERFRPQLTPSQISDILGVPFSLEARAALGSAIDEPVTNIAARKEDLRRGGVAIFLPRPGNLAKTEQIRPLPARKARVRFAIATEPQRNIPTLVVDEVRGVYGRLMAAIKAKYSPITVAITGTVGKTTAKELLAEAFVRQYRTLTVKGNNNTILTAGLVIQKLSPEDEAYIQEVHGGSPGAASETSTVLAPDIALITAIGDGHLGQMGSIERVIEGKMQIVDGLKPDGVLVINNDNEYLREQSPDVRTIRYSVRDETCDYHARDIRDDGERLEFEIVSPDGVFPAKLNFQGVHNVSNALGVFAVSREAGIPPHKIISGLSRFVPDSVRQNLIEKGGYKFLIDTYSATPTSVLSAAETLVGVPIAEGGRRIAVVSDIPDLGAKSKEDHAAVGEKLADLDIDMLLCVGTDARYMAEAAKAKGMNAYFFAWRADFNRMVVESSRPGDVLLFKGGTRAKLLEKTVYPLFGRIV